MADSEQLLVVEIRPCHGYYVTEESNFKVLEVLLETLCSDTYSLLYELIYLVWQNTRERQILIDWEAEYDMLPINFLLCLSLDLNTWCISVEEEGVTLIYPEYIPSGLNLTVASFTVPTFRCPPH